MSSFAVVKHLDVINGRTSASQADDLAPAGTEVIGSSEKQTFAFWARRAYCGRFPPIALQHSCITQRTAKTDPKPTFALPAAQMVANP